LRKSQFFTLTDLNHGLGGPWDMLGIFFVNVFLKKNSKEVFRPKKNLNSMHGFKSAILPELKNCQMALLNPYMEFKMFFGQETSFEAL
jgi:hypothetical protein